MDCSAINSSEIAHWNRFSFFLRKQRGVSAVHETLEKLNFASYELRATDIEY